MLLDAGHGSGCTTALCITIMTKERERGGGFKSPRRVPEREVASNHRPWEL